MIDIIVDARPWNKNLVISAIELGVKTFILDEGKADLAHTLGRCRVISRDGDLVLGRDILEVEIGSKDDEDQAVDSGKALIVSAKDWKIIPLENLISRAGTVYARAAPGEVKLMERILEKGVSGIVLTPKSHEEIRIAVDSLSRPPEKINLAPARIIRVMELGVGDRACIDTCSMMVEGEGILAGNSSNFLFLVHSESIQSEYCDTRPFRVNAGGVHSYSLLKGERTKYLAEIAPGDSVMVVDKEGNSREAVVGRNKIEERPLMLIEAEAGGRVSGVILQNAETIRLVSEAGPVSITSLRPGDSVLVRLDHAGRHFGKRINEKIME